MELLPELRREGGERVNRDLDPRLYTDINLCRSCVYGFQESVGYSCGISHEKLCERVVTGCTCYKESALERRRRRAAEND